MDCHRLFDMYIDRWNTQKNSVRRAGKAYDILVWSQSRRRIRTFTICPCFGPVHHFSTTIGKMDSHSPPVTQSHVHWGRKELCKSFHGLQDRHHVPALTILTWESQYGRNEKKVRSSILPQFPCTHVTKLHNSGSPAIMVRRWSPRDRSRRRKGE